MPRIQKLSAHEAQKIAAGEVVDRPANIVKELVENALDAGATQITLYLENGGKNLIRIVDNGYGMSPADARMSIEHHATSKITCLDDLKTLSTFGFRGEALSSMCAVSHVTIITKEDDALQGTQLNIIAGAIMHETAVSSNTGTEIIITHLFHNVPARKKFLKKRETEFYHILHLVQAVCLQHLGVHLKMFHDGTLALNCPPVDDITLRFAQLFEHAKAEQMLTLQDATKEITLTGAISDHQSFRYDRDRIFLFVNNRWIKNYTLSRALLKGYMNVLPPARFPTACIAITLACNLVDINIHPRKEEVQFLHPRAVELLVQEAVKKRLESQLSASLPKSSTTFARQVSAFEPLFKPTFHNHISSPPPPSAYDVKTIETVQALRIPQPVSLPSVDPETPTAIPATEHASTLIGQYKKTYLLIEQEDGLFLVDQHAAHERILYEQFSLRFDDVATVKLLFPHLITLTHQELATIAPYLPLFEQHGILVEQFSDHQLVVQATPVHLQGQTIDDVVRQVIGWINEYTALDEEQFFATLHQKLRAQMACKAAVKAGDSLTHEQMLHLLRDLAAIKNRLTCPHGRPTGWLIRLHDIEKNFKRKL